MKIFKRNKIQETIEEEIGIDPIVEAEIVLETITEMEVETITEIEVEIVETIVEIEVEEETDLLQEREEEINLDQDQVKDILTKVRFVVLAIEVDTWLTTALDWKDI